MMSNENLQRLLELDPSFEEKVRKINKEIKAAKKKKEDETRSREKAEKAAKRKEDDSREIEKTEKTVKKRKEDGSRKIEKTAKKETSKNIEKGEKTISTQIPRTTIHPEEGIVLHIEEDPTLCTVRPFRPSLHVPSSPQPPSFLREWNSITSRIEKVVGRLETVSNTMISGMVEQTKAIRALTGALQRQRDRSPHRRSPHRRSPHHQSPHRQSPHPRSNHPRPSYHEGNVSPDVGQTRQLIQARNQAWRR